jgi:hypothetical protein
MKFPEYFNLIEEYCSKVIRPFLPNCISSGFSSGSNYINQIDLEGIGQLKGSNLDFDQFHDGKASLIHFTSINNLLKIIRTKSFYLFELNKMEDKSEFEIFQKILGVEENAEYISEFKSSHFVLSTCKNSPERRKNAEMWERYGDKKKGVIIEIEVNQIINTKPDYFLGQINYSDRKIPDNIQELISRHINFLKTNTNVNPKALNKCLSVVSSFYKSKNNYGFEEEVRILKNINKPQGIYHLSNEIEYFYNSLNNQVYFFTLLPIDGNLISIKRIYLLEETFYKLDAQFFNVIRSKFEESMQSEFAYEII